MKVILLIPHGSGGGGERILSDLSSDLGVDEVVLVVFEERFSYPFQGRLISLAMPIDRRSAISRARGFIKRCWRFRRILRQEQPDAVISFMGEANFINALLAKRPIITVHNHVSAISKMRRKLEAFLFARLVRILYRRATVVAVSSAVKRDLVENYRIPDAQVVVISNAVDSEKIQKLRAEPVVCPWDPGLPVIITAGRLSREKGQWHLIRAFAAIHKQTPCQLAILGTGELEGYLKLLAQELGVEKDVYFLGWQQNPFKFIGRATLFVLPSLTEGFGLALVEAMACELPVISTDCPGGSREIIAPDGSSEYGVLIPPLDGIMRQASIPCTGTELDLADAIVHLLQDDRKRKAYAGRGLSRAKAFDYSIFIERYRNLLKLPV
jgi:glycosyltransferase involved in cell wall biosynthesis